MKIFQIFTEGKDDKKFIEDYLKHIGKNLDQIKVKEVGGWTKLHLIEQIFHQNTSLGGENLIIFDADNDFTNRRNDLLQKIAELKLQTELFLFPNNQDKGNFDTLLISISNPSHLCIYSCFDSYAQCVKTLGSTYIPPTIKDKNFSYFQALGADARPEKRDYMITGHWNLNHQILANLKSFLETYIK